jgi:ABC-type nitrate/sulfonate/bicarbonate transport system substrate-binding protein
MAMVMVARDKGMFEAEGLDVELQDFTAGKFALQAFLGGSLDFAVSGEVPVTLATLQGNRLAVVTQVVGRTINEVRIVARRDGTASSDANAYAYFHAKKRKLATSFGGGPEFFTYNFLRKYGLTENSVDVIPLRPEEMPAALASRSVDAISIFDPFAFIAERQHGADGVTFRAGDLYSELYVLVARPRDLDERRQTIVAILRALLKAHQMIQTDPAGAQAIVVKYTALQPEVVAGVWANFVFAPALDHVLTEYMNAEAHWAQEKGDVAPKALLPDMRQVIHEGPLRSVAPGAVRLP